MVVAPRLDITLSVEALSPRPGGIGRYTWELCKGLASAPPIGSLLFHWAGQLVKNPETLLRGDFPSPAQSKIARFWRSRSVRRALDSTVVHGPNYFLPKGVEGGVITVHDLSVFRFPETHPADRIAAFERDFADSLRRAAHVVTDTETVRAELIEDFGIAPDDVTSVHLGVDPLYARRNAVQCAEVLRRWGLEFGGYGLSVSTLEPRKGIAGLLSAWQRLPLELRRRFPLVLAGGTGWRNELLIQRIKAAESEGWLRHLGFVAESDLPFLYAGAALFAYPSIYEGFGLPPLEAMASGVPVIVSNRSCMPEVSGDAALLVDPEDSAALEDAITRCLTDEAWRAEAIKRGVRRAADFTWARCVDQTVDVYRRVEGLRKAQSVA